MSSYELIDGQFVAKPFDPSSYRDSRETIDYVLFRIEEGYVDVDTIGGDWIDDGFLEYVLDEFDYWDSLIEGIPLIRAVAEISELEERAFAALILNPGVGHDPGGWSYSGYDWPESWIEASGPVWVWEIHKEEDIGRVCDAILGIGDE